MQETWPIAGAFVIARASKTAAEVFVVTIDAGGFVGRGECVPYRRYGESLESVRADLEGARAAIEDGADRAALAHLLRASSARNALDCALFDLEAKTTGRRAHAIAGLPAPIPMETAFTISLDTPGAMAKAAAAAAHLPLLKLKLDNEFVAERLRAVRAAAPHATLIVDANEAWTEDRLKDHIAAAAQAGVRMIEQPLRDGVDDALIGLGAPMPICADESLRTRAELGALQGKYDMINIKLDKTGGLTEAIALARAARHMGFGIMIGCLVGTSLAMAPAVLLAKFADYLDLDGPLLLTRDRDGGLVYEGARLMPPTPDLWG